jgi:hypothetical protein
MAGIKLHKPNTKGETQPCPAFANLVATTVRQGAVFAKFIRVLSLALLCSSPEQVLALGVGCWHEGLGVDKKTFINTVRRFSWRAAGSSGAGGSAARAQRERDALFRTYFEAGVPVEPDGRVEKPDDGVVCPLTWLRTYACAGSRARGRLQGGHRQLAAADRSCRTCAAAPTRGAQHMTDGGGGCWSACPRTHHACSTPTRPFPRFPAVRQGRRHRARPHLAGHRAAHHAPGRRRQRHPILRHRVERRLPHVRGEAGKGLGFTRGRGGARRRWCGHGGNAERGVLCVARSGRMWLPRSGFVCSHSSSLWCRPRTPAHSLERGTRPPPPRPARRALRPPNAGAWSRSSTAAP